KAVIYGLLRFIVISLCLHQSLVVAISLPFSLPAGEKEYLNDSAWTDDVKEARNNKNHFVEPADTVKYTDYRYVGSHNSHVYPRFFKTVRQQDQSILGQLTYGVRGLMLDTYAWDLGAPSSLVGPK